MPGDASATKIVQVNDSSVGMRTVALMSVCACLVLGLAFFTSPSLHGQANIDRIKQKAKEVKKQVEGQPTNRVAGPKTNAPAKKPVQNPPVK